MMWDCGWVQCEIFSYVWRCFGKCKGGRCDHVMELLHWQMTLLSLMWEGVDFLQMKKVL
jgi:hypothetical protein